MAINKKIILGSVIVGILAFPLAVDYQVKDKIDLKTKDLKKDGIDLIINNNSGYFKSTREFEIVVKDSKALSKLIYNEIVTTYPEYKNILSDVLQNNQNTFKDILEGIKFTGTFKNDNYLMDKAKISISLKEFSRAFMEKIKKNKKVSKIILPLLNKGTITFHILLNTDGSVDNFAMQDIDEEIITENKTTKIKFLGNKFDIMNKNEGTYSLAQQYLESNKSKIETLGIKYSYKYKDMFNQSANLKFDNFTFENESGLITTNLTTGKCTLSNQTSSTKEKVHSSVTYQINDLNLTSNIITPILSQKFKLTTGLEDIDKKALKAITDNYQDLLVALGEENQKIDTNQTTNKFIEDLSTIVNQGLIFVVDSQIENSTYKEVTFKDISLNIDAKLNKNNLSKNSEYFEILGLIDVDSDIKIHKDDLEQIKVFQPMAELIFLKGKMEGDYMLFNVKFQNSKLTVNGSEF